MRQAGRLNSAVSVVRLLLLGWLLGTTGKASAAENLALGKPVFGDGPTWPGLVPQSLTDGNPNTFTHPATGTDTTGYFFEVDLGREYWLQRIVVRNRNDGCCPERLTRYRIEVYADAGGETGARNWSAQVRMDGSNSGVGGTDTVTADADPTRPFRGRFIRVVNPGSDAYHPQLAEIEAYGAPGPEIRFFTADDDTLEPGQTTWLRWEILNATTARLEPDLGTVSPTQGALEVRPAATTTFTLIAGNAAGEVSATLPVGVGETLAPPRLTEFVAANAAGLPDEDGDRSDWIELHNPNRFGLEVTGYYLTDSAGNRRQWQLPARKIPGGGFLLVFASGKERAPAEGELHTNFRLDAQGEYVGLVAPDGVTVVDQFPPDYPAARNYPPQLTDVAYGRDPVGNVGFHLPPTPGATNGPAYEGVVSPVQFSHERGFRTTPFDVTLSTPTPGAVIRYTLDQSEPTATHGNIYTGSLTIEQTTVLRAAAFRPGWASTDIATHTYLTLGDIVASPVMRRSITAHPEYAPQMVPALLDLPSVSLVTPTVINGSSEAIASLEWLRPEGGEGFQIPCGVRYFGGAFTEFAKKNFRLYFRSEYGAGKLVYPLFAGFEGEFAPVDEFDQLELRGGSHDMVERGFYLSNIFADDTLREAGHLSPHGRFVHLYLNGTYWGLYHLRERWGAAMQARYLGGSRTNYESINGNWNVGGWPDPGVPYDGDGSAWTTAKALRQNYREVRAWVDVPQYVDFMLTWMFGGAEDEYRCVGPNVPGSGFKFYLNDADGWFCIPQYCAADNRTARGAPGRQPGDGPGSIFSMLLRENDPDYRVLLADRIQRGLTADGALTPGRNVARLKARVAEISRAFIAESARWGYLSPSSWTARHQFAEADWLPRRTTDVLSQFRAAGFLPAPVAPVLSPAGGPVTNGTVVQFVGTGGGTVYYTLDGSDPRLPGGAVSPTARVFQPGERTETLIPTGARWRWFTSASGLGPSDLVEGHPDWSSTNWKHPDFDDRAWAEGRAELGYGDGDETTVLPFGPSANNKWITSYFRLRFLVDDRGGVESLRLRLKRDDGAVVYLNGREAVRSGLGPGRLTAGSRAENAEDDGQIFLEFELSPALVQNGLNVVAVELHQTSPTSSDASFDLALSALRPAPASGELPLLDRNTVVRARNVQGTEWSGLAEAFYQTAERAVGPGDLVVSEFHPHPADSAASEFVELENVSAQAVNLRGVSFREGIVFTFPHQRDTILAPGQRLVLVSDLFQFQQRHGLEVPVAGIFSGRLNNAGEQITLADSAGQTLLSFSYGTSSSWPAEARGGGYTLVLARPELGLGNPAAWRISRLPWGSPGTDDALHFAGEPTLDADGDRLPALLEYALGTRDDDPTSGPGALVADLHPTGESTLTFRREVGADDVLIWVESSPDLLEWQPARKTASHPDGLGRLVETWSAADPGQSALFLRVRVSQR